MLREVAAVGLHPFLLVRAASPNAEGGTFLVCKTQNDAPEFVHRAAMLPGFAQSRLVRGIERALQLEVYEAADSLFAWTKHVKDELEESVYIGLPGRTFLRGYAGYPVFGIGSGAPSADRELRVQMLVETFEAYCAASGNDALRFALIEALGFALSRALGSLGRFTAAEETVDEALEHKPYSIHLKAAKHALGLKRQGSEVPQRLAKFIGEDNGYLKQFVCSQPFKRFDIGPSGDVLVCCGHWLPTSIGNFINSPVEEVLNSPTAQKLRRSVTDGTYKYCNHLDCGEMIQDTLPRREDVKDQQIVNAIAHQDFQIEGVEQVLFALDRTCNLSCPSCRTERISEKMWESEEKVGAVDKKLLPLLPTLRVLNINPAGELFASKLSRNVLKLINDESAPDLVLDIISNGTLFSEEEWNKFPGIHRKIRSVRISTDASSKETFETLRRGGRYEVFLKNLRFLASLRASGVIPQLKFSFTYQRDNFREMRDFVAFCESYNADFAIFERLQNLGAFTDNEFRKRAVHIPSHPLHEEFLAVVRDPIFRSKRVWHDFDYPGVENMSADEARARLVEALRAGTAEPMPELGDSRPIVELSTDVPRTSETPLIPEPVPSLEAESRIENEKFLYIAALPKSASSLVWLFVSALQESTGRPNPARQKGEAPNPFLSLQPEVLNLFPDGGTYKSHAPFNVDTARVLKETDCKYIVLLRHPADFVAALYCHMLGHVAQRAPDSEESARWIEGISPLRSDMFRPGVPIDDAIAYLLKEGGLFGALEWMAQWLACRSESRSIVVRYEDVMQRFDDTLERLSLFIRGAPAPEDVRAYLSSAVAAGQTASSETAEKYPHGWTGRVGAWRSYFSDMNVELFNKTVAEFLSCHPSASSLAAVYPDLRISSESNDAGFNSQVNRTIDGLRSRHLAVSWGDRLLTIDKTAGFRRDPAFASAFDTIQGSIQYDEYNGPEGIAWRLNTLCWAAKCALRAGGDFVECGVHKGDMAWVVLNTVGPARIPRFFLFDSFEGFSKKYSSPQDFPLNPGFLEFANNEYRQKGQYERVRDRFAAFANVRVIKGFLPDALDIDCPERIGFLHIDLNSPRAEIAVLERLFERVVSGGVVVFDDYGWKLFEKQKLAEDEFLGRLSYEVLELPTGQGLVVKR
jgi:hypothetical protein